MAWCAVIGDPIEHSLSPLIHAAAYRSLGVELEYRKFQVSSEALPEFMTQLDGCKGLSVTMPLKDQIGGHLDRIDGLAKVTGAINTVVPAAQMLAGFNTDVYGIVAAAKEFGVENAEKVTVLGAGSTAASALAAAVELGAKQVTIAARRPRSIMVHAHQMGVEARMEPLQIAASTAGADLLISTLPGGAADNLNLQLNPAGALLDVAYSPWPSQLVQRAHASGMRIIPGVAMLVHQACQQVSLFCGSYPDPDVMYQALAGAGINYRLD